MHLLPAIDILGGKAVRLAKGDYNRVTVYNDDPVAQANKLRSLPQFWFYDRRGELSGKLAERFTEEDISKAFEAAHKGR